MNRLELTLRDCKAELGERETLALASMLFSDAESKSRRHKIIRTTAFVLGIQEKFLLDLFSRLEGELNSLTILDTDGSPILKNGEFVWGGERND